jgi:hypothetical protein
MIIVDRCYKMAKLFIKFYLMLFLLIFTACNGKDSHPNNTAKQSDFAKVDAISYYKEYSGHKVADLKNVFRNLKADGCEEFIFYGGDSSLDNKYWVFSLASGKNDKESIYVKNISAPATNGYEKFLTPPRMIKDIDYWMNKYLKDNQKALNKRICSIMTSVEESTLNGRKNRLLPQDQFVQDHISANDYLIISIGGNDIAFNVDDSDVKKHLNALKNNPNDRSAFSAILPIFKEKTEKYIKKLVNKSKPKKIIINMIYYPDENPHSASWVSRTLNELDYDRRPSLLQSLVDKFYQLGTKEIYIEHSQVIPLQLSHVLDGKNSNDYVSRIEPSVSGGKKMARFFIEALFGIKQ